MRFGVFAHDGHAADDIEALRLERNRREKAESTKMRYTGGMAPRKDNVPPLEPAQVCRVHGHVYNAEDGTCTFCGAEPVGISQPDYGEQAV